MLYTAHFNLREAPFRATPDPRFFYRNAVYREAYATLLYGVLQRKGLIALTGEVGTGKTTLLRRLMDEVGASVRFVLFYNTTLTFDETVEFICGELDIPVGGLSRVQRLQRLNELLIAEARRGGTVALLIDEAQNLGLDVLENLRLISNLETSTEKLLQIVLVGQPELDARLAEPALRQVAQRIAVRSRLVPLRDDEIEPFIDHRLRRCGGRCRALFTTGAIRRITAYAKGVPRVINVLGDGGLVAAYGAGATGVTSGMIDDVAADLGLCRHRRTAAPPATRARRWVAAGVAALAIAGAVVVLRGGSSLMDALPARPGLLEAAFGGRTVGPAIEQPAAAALPASAVAATARAVDSANEATSSPPMSAHLPLEGWVEHWQTIVPRGMTVSEVVSRRYGRHQLLGLELVKDLNPQIVNLDRVATGEPLWMAALTLDTLARRQPDGFYELIVASLMTPDAANRLAGHLRLRGYQARVAARDITPGFRVHRVVLERLESREAVRRAWTTVGRLGWLPPVDAGARRGSRRS
jgi:general secretion pathway protein A